jgi:hypothetical protein
VQNLTKHLDRHGFKLQSCIYDVGLQRNLISEIVDAVLGSVGSLDDEHAIKKEKEMAFSRFGLKITPLAPILKHPDFREEQEWRAFAPVPADDARMQHHIKGPIAIPHCVLDMPNTIGDFPVVGITAGPSTHQDLALKGITAMLFRTGLRINTDKSSTPLRAL